MILDYFVRLLAHSLMSLSPRLSRRQSRGRVKEFYNKILSHNTGIYWAQSHAKDNVYTLPHLPATMNSTIITRHMPAIAL